MYFSLSYFRWLLSVEFVFPNPDYSVMIYALMNLFVFIFLFVTAVLPWRLNVIGAGVAILSGTR